MKKNLEKDFVAARYLNGHIFVPSNCFTLMGVPSVKHIVCGNDLPSRMIAEQLKQQIALQSFMYPKIHSGLDNAVLDMAKDVDGQVERFLQFVKESGLKAEEIIIIAKLDMFLAMRGDSRLHGAVFCIREFFMYEKDFSHKPFLTRIDGRNPQYFGNKLLKNVDYVIAYDDDMTSAFYAAMLWWELILRYGYFGPSGCKRMLICLGGKGKLSTFLYSQTEGQMQKKSVCRLFVRPEDVVVLDGGNNTGANLKALVHTVIGNTAIVAMTQRLSAIWDASLKHQFPHLKVMNWTIYEKVGETLKWLNGMRLSGGKPILHYWAHIIKRCHAYEGKFMVKVEGIDEHAEECGRQLASRYFIKQPGMTFKTIMQYIPILWNLLRHRKDVRRDYEQAVSEFQQKIRKRYAEFLPRQ